MFDIGFSELVVIAVIALIVLGPERLPEAARALGGWVAKARRFMRTMSEELERETDFKGFRDLKDEFDSSRRKFEEEWERGGRNEAHDERTQESASEAEQETAAGTTADDSADGGDAGAAADRDAASASKAGDAATVTNGSGAKRKRRKATDAGAADGETAVTEPKPKAAKARKPRSAAKPKAARSRKTSTTSKPRPKSAQARRTRKPAAGSNDAAEQSDTHETVARERERNT